MKYKFRRYYFYYLLKTAVMILSRLPVRVNLAVGALLGRAAGYIIPRYRKTAVENISTALGADGSQSRRITSDMFANLGKNGAEWIAANRMKKEDIPKLVTEASGLEKIDRELAKGKGVIFLAFHFGNWELMPLYLNSAGYQGVVIAKRIYFYKYDKFVARLRTRFGLQLVYKDESPKRILKNLRDGRMVGMLADQDTGGVKGVFVPFFGRDAWTPTAPVEFALRTGASLVPVFVVRKRDDTHTVMVEDPIDMSARTGGEEDVIKYTRAWTAVLEKYAREHPEQWVWLHRRWKTRPEAK